MQITNERLKELMDVSLHARPFAIAATELDAIMKEVMAARASATPQEGDIDMDRVGSAYRVFEGGEWGPWKPTNPFSAA